MSGGFGNVELVVQVHFVGHGVELTEIGIEEVDHLTGHDSDGVPVHTRRSPGETVLEETEMNTRLNLTETNASVNNISWAF